MTITFVHNFENITAIYKDNVEVLSFDVSRNIQSTIANYAAADKEALLVWVHELLVKEVNYDWIKNNVKEHKMFFYNPTDVEFLTSKIGYVEPSPFIKINKKGCYASWQASAFVGGILAADFLKFGSPFLNKSYSFGYFLSIFAKIGHRKGLLAYSNPTILMKSSYHLEAKVGTTLDVFRWTAQYYGFYKCLQLFLILSWFEKQFPIFAFLKVLGVKRIIFDNQKVNVLEREASDTNKLSVDVLIPTIGRKKYLYDVLCDLKLQTKVPNRIIIVEQNPLAQSESELDYLTTASWPFQIIHHFIHQTGACNARNIALKEVKSDWVFFADDDIKLTPNFIEDSLKTILHTSESVFTLACFRPNEKPVFQNLMHWDTFGSGCSIVKKEALRGLQFDMRFENGFGEDADFGMQLRYKGFDVLYLPQPQILHLKAPVGGFRVKPTLPWQDELIQPKPSPTVMLFKIVHHTKEQITGYKLNLFLKYYKQQAITNPFKYYQTMQKQWKISVKWAQKLQSQSK